MSGFKKALTLGLATGMIGGFLMLTPLGSALEESVGLRWLFKARGAVDAPPRVVIVAIDRRSAAALEQLPRPHEWQRHLHACLIDRLVQLGAATIVFDVAFSAPHARRGTHAAAGGQAPARLLLGCEQPPAHENDDVTLSRSMASSGRTVILEFISQEKIAIPSGEIIKEQLVPPISPLAESAAGVGPFPLPKKPHSVSRFWAFKTVADEVVPTLPVVALQIEAGRELLQLLAQAVQEPTETQRGAAAVRSSMRQLRDAFLQRPELLSRVRAALATAPAQGLPPGRRDALAALARTYGGEASHYLNFYGPPGTVTTVPYSALVTDTQSPRSGEALDFAGKVVFVGASELASVEQFDHHYTVFSRADGVDLSGVEIAATAFANLLTDRTLRVLRPWTSATVLFGFGCSLGLLTLLLPGMRALAGALILGGLYFGAAHVLFVEDAVWLPVFVPLSLQIPIALLLGWYLQYSGARRSRETMRRAMSRYVPDQVVDRIQRNEGSAADETVYGACLKTDVQGYTSIAERVGNRRLRRLTNEYYGLIVEPIAAHHGEVLDIIGDGLTCVWTAQQPSKQLRTNACRAALDILEAVERFNRRHPDEPFRTRIGLHAGFLIMGDVGGGGHYAYSATGDIVNTASRNEGLNKYLGTWILATESVIAGLDELLLRRVGTFQLVGKSEPLSMFEIMAYKDRATQPQQSLCRRFATPLRAFDAGRWAEAAAAFEALLAIYPQDGPTKFYSSLSRRYCTTPPPAEQGSLIRLLTK